VLAFIDAALILPVAPQRVVDWLKTANHSYRSETIGSTRAALLAGIHAAATAKFMRTSAAEKLKGSAGVTLEDHHLQSARKKISTRLGHSMPREN
jgi:hypothetical protein